MNLSLRNVSVLSLFGLLVFTTDAQTSLKLNPSRDVAIGYHTNYNTGVGDKNAIQSAAYCIPGASGGLNVNQAVMDFDLSQIPAKATIVSAKLHLYATGPIGTLSGHTGSNNGASLQRIITPWDENTVSWNYKPTSTSINQVVLAASTSSDQDYLNIDMTVLVKDMVSKPDSSFGLVFKLLSESTTNALVFCSSNHSNAAKHPVLEIIYTCDSITTELKVAKDVAIGYHDNYNTGVGDKNAIQSAAYCIPGSSGGLNVNRAIMDFDLSEFTSADEILEAKLSLYATGPIGTLPGHTGTNNAAYLQRITESWTESASWVNQPNSSSLNQVLLPASASFNQDYLDIDVSELIKDMIANPDSSFGLLLKLQTENTKNALVFCSSNHSNASKHPVLKITRKVCDDSNVVSGCTDPLAYNFNKNATQSGDSCKYVNIELTNTVSTIAAVDTLGTEAVNTCGKIDVAAMIQYARILNHYFTANGIAVTWEISQGGNKFNFDVLYNSPSKYGWILFTFSINCEQIGGGNFKTLGGGDEAFRTFGDAILLSPTGVESLPTANNAFSLKAFPNPLNQENLTLLYALSENTPVIISIYNTLGELVFTQNALGQKGENNTVIKLNHLTSGVYLCKLSSGTTSETIRIVK